jgi:uncharacterized protein (UPF0335 family)
MVFGIGFGPVIICGQDYFHVKLNIASGEESADFHSRRFASGHLPGYRPRNAILAPETTTMAETTDDRLRLLIERVERLEEEKKGIADDIRDVYAEAKAVGYDAKIMRQIVRLRKMKPDDRAEMETILDLYKAALGLG